MFRSFSLPKVCSDGRGLWKMLLAPDFEGILLRLLFRKFFFKIKDIRNRESSYTYSTVWRNHFKIAKYKFIRIGPQLQQRPVFFWLLELFWTHSKYVRVPKTFWEISSKLPGICCQIAKKDGWAFYRGIHHQCLSIIDLLLGIMCQILHIILNPTDLFFEGQPSKTMPLSIKTRAILGSRYMLRHPQHLLQKTWCQHLFRIQSYLPSLTLNLRLRGDHVFPKNHLYTSGESTGVIRLPILGRSNNANRWSIWRIYLVIVHCLSRCPTMTPDQLLFFKVNFCNPVST